MAKVSPVYLEQVDVEANLATAAIIGNAEEAQFNMKFPTPTRYIAKAKELVSPLEPTTTAPLQRQHRGSTNNTVPRAR
eukprot:CAMPEP_0184328742 /NCGR_PEP_ID=MMETSP1049-20130417/143782_1 /TAXON_ID=77928 /ORGANISM="Proteomonas sulcata, Strain CCMP704" /LENGTH=77 /DNA_ID=CAMNT_0026651069 /DNA_START=217 /DNA_END=451 /DNA_ORIENTATION=+